MQLRLFLFLLLWAGSLGAQVIGDDVSIGNQVAPHHVIEAIGFEIEKLETAGLLRKSSMRFLMQPLDRSSYLLRVARPERASKSLKVFDNRVNAKLPPDLANSLLFQSDLAREIIADLVAGKSLVTPGNCKVPDDSEYTILNVGDDEQFATVEGAFEYANAKSLEAIELRLAEGLHRTGSLELSRHTRLVAANGRASIIGRIVNVGPYVLDLRNIVIANSVGSGIHVDNHCAVTNLESVEIQRTNGSGIRQIGGKLSVRELLIAFSGGRPGPEDPHVGRGMHLSDGVSACIAGARFDRNEAGAILAAGLDTQIYVSRLRSTNDRLSSQVVDELIGTRVIPEGAGIVEVRDQALLLADFLSVESGEGYGVLVAEGAQANLRYSIVDRTRGVRHPDAPTTRGFNITVKGGALELNSVQSSRGFVGLFLVDMASSPAAASSTSVVNNIIGTGYRANDGAEASCALSCLDATYSGNDRRLDGNVIGTPLPDPGVCPTCIEVPLSPTWCAD